MDLTLDFHNINQYTIQYQIDSYLYGFFIQQVHYSCLDRLIFSYLHTNTSPKAHPFSLKLMIMFDGGSRGNPGTGGAGFVILNQSYSNSTLLHCDSFYLSNPKTTNNMAEVIALRRASYEIFKLVNNNFMNSTKYLEIRGDSKLILNQLQGFTTISNGFLKQQYIHIRKNLQHCSITYSHYKRESNSAADYLANLAMDSQTSKSNRDFRPAQLDQIRSCIDSDLVM